MIYEWDTNLETGNKIIDAQHKHLIETLNKLVVAHQESHGAAVLGTTLEFMKNYVEQHFHDEEMLQIEYKYPQYEHHKQLHNDFKFVVKNLLSQLEEHGYTNELIEKTIQTMAEWLITHIKGDDLKMALYIQKAETERRNSKNL